MRSDLDNARGDSAASIGPRGAEARPQHALPSHKTARRVLILLLCALFASACAETGKKPYKRLPPKGEKPPAQMQLPPAEKPVPPSAPRSNATPSTQDAVTPQRQASLRLVNKGAALLAAGDTDRAAAIFMDAINVDGSNGIAYYHLAVVNQQQGKNEIALGLLDKAEAMLGADQEWMGKIDELRTAMGGSPPAPIGPSPIDQQF